MRSGLKSYNAAVKTILLVLLFASAALGQAKPGINEKGVYQNTDVGFSFTPPDGLRDVTTKADSSGDKDPKAIQLLLFELSGPNSTDVNWRGLAVQSFAREEVSAASDFEAELKLSRTILGGATAVGQPTKLTIGDLTYAVSEYERTHGVVTEHTRVYATVIHSQMVAFAFTANATGQLDAMADSLKSVKVKN